VGGGVALFIDEAAAEVELGGEGVVGAAAEREVRGGVRASRGEGFEMVKLEAMRLGAASSAGVDVAAAAGVARKDGAPTGSGDVTTAPAR
jgi:hypothetical protein